MSLTIPDPGKASSPRTSGRNSPLNIAGRILLGLPGQDKPGPISGGWGLPDPLGIAKGSKEWKEKHPDPPPPPPPPPPLPGPPPSPGSAVVTQAALEARKKAAQNMGGVLLGTAGGAAGLTDEARTTAQFGKSLLGQ